MNRKLQKLSLLCLLPTTFLLSGCARDISSSTYAASHVGEASHTYRGVVTNVRAVTVQGGESLQDNALGLIGGGVAGGVAGSFLGGGRARIATTLLGAAAGATAGTLAEKELKKQNALEYTVKLESGQMRTVVQGPDNPMGVGQHVLLMVSSEGRSRVVPDFSGQPLK